MSGRAGMKSATVTHSESSSHAEKQVSYVSGMPCGGSDCSPMREAVVSRQIVYLPDDTTALALTLPLLLNSCCTACSMVLLSGLAAVRMLEAPTSVDGMALKHNRSLQQHNA